jgi:hypothetical protein
MPTPVFHAGFEGNVVTDDIDRNVHGWSGTETVKEIDVTNTSNFDAVSGRCFEDAIFGTTKFEGEFKFFFDSAQLPYDIRPGTYITGLVLNIARTNGTTPVLNTVTFPRAMVTKVAFSDAGMDKAREVTVSFRNKGTYTYA